MCVYIYIYIYIYISLCIYTQVVNNKTTFDCYLCISLNFIAEKTCRC